jgi:hypothetical protein
MHLLGVRGLVTALSQGAVDPQVRFTKAVTSPRTPRRGVTVEYRFYESGKLLSNQTTEG